MRLDATARRYWAFRGRLGSDLIAWGTTVLHQPAGAIRAVLVEPPSGFQIGPSFAIGEPPPQVSTTLVVADPDGDIAARLQPDRRGGVALSGRLLVGELGPDGDPLFEVEVSPTLYVSGAVRHHDGLTTIPVASDYSRILGPSIALWSVMDVLGAELVRVSIQGIRDNSAMLDYLDSRPETFLFEEALSVLKQNEATIVPWLYDPCITELIPLCDDYPRYWVGGVVSPPRYPSVIVGDFSGAVRPYNDMSLNLGLKDWRQKIGEFLATITIEDALGNKREVSVLMYMAPEPPEDEAQRILRACRVPDGVFAGRSPPELLRQLVVDHAPAGEDGIDQTSYQRASRTARSLYSGVCGGVFGRDGGTIAEALQYIAPICGMRTWIGANDRLHMALGGYSYEDAQAAKGTLPELVEGDIYPRDTSYSPAWETEIAGDPDDDQGGVARVSIQWTDDQVAMYPIETLATSPVLGSGPGSMERERILRGEWIVPQRGRDVIGALQASVAGEPVRAQLVTHLDLPDRVLLPPQLIRITHPRGLGLPGMGWNRRLARIEVAELIPGEDAKRLTVTDLGPSERMRLGLLDSVTPWIVDRAGTGENLIILFISDNIWEVWNLARFATNIEEGMTLWTPGAAREDMRRSWRVVEISGAQVYVMPDEELEPGGSDVFATSDDPVLGVGWAVMRTDLIDPSYRIDYIRACDVTGLFESGEPGFQYSG